ncbi:MAG: hypothetical protein JWO96_655 [Candidatus Saccharibacteria bacterium]|nr:hypothetical protein [Candidatus Saccharibacteria bacterium]
MKAKFSSKALKLSKDQSALMGTVAAATVISVFSLVSIKALAGQVIYQGKVISARHNSAKQMKANISNANTLVTQYNSVFLGSSPDNIIGGKNDSSTSAVPPNGNNGRIVLDALPTVYDFPALLTSMSKVLTNNGIGSQSIGGSDQSSTVKSDPTGNPQPANIDLTVSGTGTYKDTARLIKDMERSIRPFDITHLAINGNESSLTIDLNLTTYYQPAKTLSITSKEIR